MCQIGVKLKIYRKELAFVSDFKIYRKELTKAGDVARKLEFEGYMRFGYKMPAKGSVS